MAFERPRSNGDLSCPFERYSLSIEVVALLCSWRLNWLRKTASKLYLSLNSMQRWTLFREPGSVTPWIELECSFFCDRLVSWIFQLILQIVHICYFWAVCVNPVTTPSNGILNLWLLAVSISCSVIWGALKPGFSFKFTLNSNLEYSCLLLWIHSC